MCPSNENPGHDVAVVWPSCVWSSRMVLDLDWGACGPACWVKPGWGGLVADGGQETSRRVDDVLATRSVLIYLASSTHPPWNTSLIRGAPAELDPPRPNSAPVYLENRPQSRSIYLLIHSVVYSDWHLGRFGRFCTAHGCAKHTDTQTVLHAILGAFFYCVRAIWPIYSPVCLSFFYYVRAIHSAFFNTRRNRSDCSDFRRRF